MKNQLLRQNLVEVLEPAGRAIFHTVCEQHLKAIDMEYIERFSAVLKKNKEVMASLDYNSREMYARMLIRSDAMDDHRDQFCSLPCAKGNKPKHKSKSKIGVGKNTNS